MRIKILAPNGHLDDIGIKQVEHQLGAIGVTNATSTVSLVADPRVPGPWWLVIDGEGQSTGLTT